jgi:hypothetical protein
MCLLELVPGSEILAGDIKGNPLSSTANMTDRIAHAVANTCKGEWTCLPKMVISRFPNYPV